MICIVGAYLSSRIVKIYFNYYKTRLVLHSSINFKGDDLSSDTDQAEREHRIGGQLKDIKEQLNTYVTSPLQAPVVKQDQLRLAVRLDLLIRLSENLQELYTEIQGMISEAAKCSEDLRRDYYDLAYHGLRAEHFNLVHKVEDLESAQEKMSEEERKEYDRLQSYQKDRQRQVEALDKVWRRLFSPVCEQSSRTSSSFQSDLSFSIFPSIKDRQNKISSIIS